MNTLLAREQQDLEEFKDLTLAEFTFVGTLGMGGFGRVELVCIIHVTFEVVIYRYICMLLVLKSCRFKITRTKQRVTH